MRNREPGRSGTRTSAAGTTSPAPRKRRPPRSAKARPDEEELFGAGRGPNIFGEGEYGSGGAANQGNYELRDRNPQGAVGSFDDAGGFGGTRLLGGGATGGGRTEQRRRAETRRSVRRIEPK